MADRTVGIELRAKINNYMSNMKRAGRQAETFQNENKKAHQASSDLWKRTALAAGVGAVAVAVGIKKAINAASDLNEATEKSGQVFGQYHAGMEKWASQTANAIGISKRAALDSAATYGNLFTAFGVGEQKAASMSQNLVNLAADLASFGNTSVDQALTAISSGMAGEMEPMKRYGAILSQVRIQQKAFEMGLVDTKSKGLDPTTKALATYELIMQDTAKAQGDATRMAEEGAQAQRRAAANFEDMKASVGEGLLPVWTTLMKALNGGLGVLDRLPGPLKTGAILILALGLAAVAAGPRILAFKTALTQSGVSLGRFGKIAKGAGIAAAIFAIGQAIGAALNPDHVNVDRFTQDLRTLATTGNLTGAALDQAGDDFSSFKDNLNLIVDPNLGERFNNMMGALGEGVFGAESYLSEATRKFEEWDQTLTSLFNTDPGQAFQIWDRLKAEAQSAGRSVEELEARFPGFTAAVDSASDATGKGADELRKMTNEAAATEDQIKAVQTAFDQFAANFDDERAAIAFQEQMRSLKTEFAELSGAQLQAARNMDITTEAGSRTKSAFLDLISSAQKAAQVQYDQTAATQGDAAAREQAGQVMDHYRGKIESLASKLNLSKSETRALIAQMGSLGSTKAKPKVDLVGNAKKEVESIDAKIRRLRGKKLVLEASGNAKKQAADVDSEIRKLQARKKKIMLEADGSKAKTESRNVGQVIGKIKQNRKPKIDVDEQPARDGARQAQEAINAVKGKTVTITARKVGPGQATGGWAGYQPPRGYAGGGRVHGPGSETSDSIFAKLSRNEYVVNARAAKRYGKLLEYINSGGNLPGFARGGKVRYTVAQKIKKGASGGLGKPVQRAVSTYKKAVDAQSAAKRDQKQVIDARKSHIAGVQSSIAGGGVNTFDLNAYAQAQENTARAVEAQAQAQKDLADASRKANTATNPADRKAALLERAEAQRKLAESIAATAAAKKAEADAKPSKANILKSGKSKAAQARKFLADIQTMQKKGFSAAIIKDVIGKGLDEGAEWAAILSTFSASEVREHNTSMSVLSSVGASLGAIDANLTAGVNQAALKAAQAKVTAANKKVTAAKKTVAKTKVKKKAAGGFVYGPGTGTSDDIPTMLSNREFVVQSKYAVKNANQLEYLNRTGEWPQGFAAGGFVGVSMSNHAPTARQVASAVNLTVQLDSRDLYQGLVDLADRSGGTLPSIKIKATAG